MSSSSINPVSVALFGDASATTSLFTPTQSIECESQCSSADMDDIADVLSFGTDSRGYTFPDLDTLTPIASAGVNRHEDSPETILISPMTNIILGNAAQEHARTSSAGMDSIRKRIACVACARSKSRCNKSEPKCTRCHEKGIDCHPRFGAASRTRSTRFSPAASGSDDGRSSGSSSKTRGPSPAVELTRVQRRGRGPGKRVSRKKNDRIVSTSPSASPGDEDLCASWQYSKPNEFLPLRTGPLNLSMLSPSSSDGLPITPEKAIFSSPTLPLALSHGISPPPSPELIAGQGQLFDGMANNIFSKSVANPNPERMNSNHHSSASGVVPTSVRNISTAFSSQSDYSWSNDTVTPPGQQFRESDNIFNSMNMTPCIVGQGMSSNSPLTPIDFQPFNANSSSMPTTFPVSSQTSGVTTPNLRWKNHRYFIPVGGESSESLGLQGCHPPITIPNPSMEAWHRYCLLNNYLTTLHGPNYMDTIDFILAASVGVIPFFTSTPPATAKNLLNTFRHDNV